MTPSKQDKKEIKVIKKILKIKDDPIVVLNEHLVKKQNLSEKDQDKIQKLHRVKFAIFEKMKTEPDLAKLKKYAEIIEKLEFKAQVAWKFKKDATKHSWWFNCPRCLCPKTDNQDQLGSGRRTINAACPVHGGD
jgi:hypothetical protein